jgi:glutathione S-transferase
MARMQWREYASLINIAGRPKTMKLYVAPRAPNPRRVTIFIAEKGIGGIESIDVDLNAGEHRSTTFLARSPLSKVPVLELDDGRFLSESRAICGYLEGLHPEPNLLGRDYIERAFIEMTDRQIELYLFAAVANCIRHTHPGLAPLERPQIAEFGQAQGRRVREVATWLDARLAAQAFMAGERFTVADITALCALDFAKGLMKFRPGDEGLTHLQAWRDRVSERPSARA